FSGGVTIDAGATVTLERAQSAGTGTIQFAGSDAVLALAGGPVSNVIFGVAATDAIDLPNVTWSGGPPTLYRASADGVLTIPTAQGSESLNFSGLAPQTAFLASSDGHGGTLLTSPYPSVSVTVSNQAQLARAIAAADAVNIAGETYTINFAPGSD